MRIGQTVQFHVRDATTASEDLQLLLDAQQLDDAPTPALRIRRLRRKLMLFRQNVDSV